jgi:GTPase SAR1 family protein
VNQLSRVHAMVAFVGVKGSGKTSSIRTFMKALYPDYEGWKHDAVHHTVAVRLMTNITFLDVPSTVGIDTLFSDKDLKPRMIVLVIKPSQIRKPASAKKLRNSAKKIA